MKNAIIILFLTFQFQILLGQETSVPKIISNSKTCEGFIPKGWFLISKKSGDLNSDNKDDLIFVIQKNDNNSFVINHGFGNDTLNNNPRVLIIAFKDTLSDSFKLMCQNNTFILRHNEPTIEEPFIGLDIVKGKITIEFNIFYNVGSWSVTNSVYQFRFQNNKFTLIGVDKHSFMRNSGDSETNSVNFLTKKMSTTIGNEFNESIIPKTTWKNIQIKEIPILNNLIEPFTLEIDDNVMI